MKQYLDLLQYILDYGVEKADRTGTGTISVFGYQTRYDLSQGFPLLTTKKVYHRAIIHELLWFLSGATNIKYLVRNDVKIWNEWAYQKYLEAEGLTKKYPMYSDAWREKLERFVEQVKNDDKFADIWGELGPVYGKQWRRWQALDGREIDQVEQAIDMIKRDPTSRRIIISGWNVGEIQALVRDKTGAPPPCHTLFQFYVAHGRLSCQLYQRSADVFLGVPFNIASYSLMTMMFAKLTGLKPGEFVHTFGDVHIYKNHLNQVKEQLTRQPRPLPQMIIHGNQKKVEDFKFEDFELIGYDPHPAIKAPISV